MKWSIGFILTGAVSSIWELGKHLSESLGMSKVCIILLDSARHRVLSSATWRNKEVQARGDLSEDSSEWQ